MYPEVVVVSGKANSPLKGLPDESEENKEFAHIFSKRNYGNHLDELWKYLKDLALTLDSTPDPLFIHMKNENWGLITDAIDGLGVDSGINTVVEASGSLFRGKCLRCQTLREITRTDYSNLPDGEVFECFKCGKNRVRPDLVLWGERRHKRKMTDEMINTAEAVVFVSVDEDSDEAWHWANLSRKLIVVNEKPGSLNVKNRIHDQNEWRESGFPITVIES